MLGIFTALGIGGLFKALASVVGLFKGRVEVAFTGGKTAFYGGTDISPMLMAVGFIVGWEVASPDLSSAARSPTWRRFPAWPGVWISAGQDMPQLVGTLGGIWNTQIRYFGIGAMLVAGIYSIAKISGPRWAPPSAPRFAWRARARRHLGAAAHRAGHHRQGAVFAAPAVGGPLSSVVYYIMTQSLPETVHHHGADVRPRLLLRGGGGLHRRAWWDRLEQPGLGDDHLHRADLRRAPRWCSATPARRACWRPWESPAWCAAPPAPRATSARI